MFVNRGRITGKPIEEQDADPKLKESIMAAVEKLYKGNTAKMGDHMGNFFEAWKYGKWPISDVDSQHRSVSACHLANISIRLKRKLTWDAAKEQFVGDSEANAMLNARRSGSPYTLRSVADTGNTAIHRLLLKLVDMTALAGEGRHRHRRLERTGPRDRRGAGQVAAPRRRLPPAALKSSQPRPPSCGRAAGRVLAVPADITRQTDVDALVADTLAHSAGSTCWSTTPAVRRAAGHRRPRAEEFAELMDLNLMALVRCTRAAMPPPAGLDGPSGQHRLAGRQNGGPLHGRLLGHQVRGQRLLAAIAIGAGRQRGLHVLLVSPGPIARDEPREYSAEKVVGCHPAPASRAAA